MRDRIIINTDLVPYSFDILLAAEWYTMRVDYNSKADVYTISLFKNGEPLVYNEPIMYGEPLFADVYRAGVFPPVDIVAWDESMQETTATSSNFGKTVFLTIDQDGDEK